jgi:1,4-dihydroxy-6-naphthoate synthase
MPDVISLGISTCPNDTFIFDAWINGKLENEFPAVHPLLADISTLNKKALNSELDVVKVSFFAYGFIRDQYSLLNCGGAMGRGCGPVLVAESEGIFNRIGPRDLRIAVPGRLTTANLLFSLYRPDVKNKTFLRFDEIMPAVERGDVDAGVVIHEGRFTVNNYGLKVIEDLGKWWEYKTGLIIPLGAIVARKDLGCEKIFEIEQAVRASLQFAHMYPGSSLEFIKHHAGEMDEKVVDQHIKLYVNQYSFDFGIEGCEAVRVLLDHAEKNGLLK